MIPDLKRTRFRLSLYTKEDGTCTFSKTPNYYKIIPVNESKAWTQYFRITLFVATIIFVVTVALSRQTSEHSNRRAALAEALANGNPLAQTQINDYMRTVPGYNEAWENLEKSNRDATTKIRALIERTDSRVRQNLFTKKVLYDNIPQEDRKYLNHPEVDEYIMILKNQLDAGSGAVSKIVSFHESHPPPPLLTIFLKREQANVKVLTKVLQNLEAAREETLIEMREAEAKKKSWIPSIIILCLVLLACGFGVVFYFNFCKHQSPGEADEILSPRPTGNAPVQWPVDIVVMP